MEIEKITGALLEKVIILESKAFTSLVISDFATAENLYQEYYEILRIEEEKLSKNRKYHKGTPLHNWGIALLNEGKITIGFEKIILAFIEDVLNSPEPKEALKAPAYVTLLNNTIIDREFLKTIFNLANEAREKNIVPKNPEQILEKFKKGLTEKEGKEPSLPASFTVKAPDEVKTINASNPTPPEKGTPNIPEILKNLGQKEKLVFVGGGHRNIALLRGIRDIVAGIDSFKPILVSDFPLDINEHDKSMMFLEGCGTAIFEISISNGHLMEIERACDFENKGSLRFILLYQGIRDTSDPITTAMLGKFSDHMVRYTNLEELKGKIQEYLLS